MEFEEKIHELRNKIERQLLPLIDDDYVLWDCPYHSNIGDILIWEGERQFLENVKYQCLNITSKDFCLFPDLSSGIVILLHGGGNFGDLWREHQEFRLEIIRRYPEHRIIMFPQSVYYESGDRMKEDAQEMARHPDLILCARDYPSYALLKENFRNRIMLVPDMAFCIPVDYLKQYCRREEDKALFLKRRDKELSTGYFYPQNMECRDWPSMERRMWKMFLFEKSLGMTLRLNKWGLNYFYRMGSGVINWYAQHFLRPALVKTGVEFLSHYRYVYTTRLHVMILSILLGKECTFFDNSYGKNSAFYETWLKDLPEVKRAEKTAL